MELSRASEIRGQCLSLGETLGPTNLPTSVRMFFYFPSDLESVATLRNKLLAVISAMAVLLRARPLA
eukprot:4578964-Pyramimonas_sp.AAC.1